MAFNISSIFGTKAPASTTSPTYREQQYIGPFSQDFYNIRSSSPLLPMSSQTNPLAANYRGSGIPFSPVVQTPTAQTPTAQTPTAKTTGTTGSDLQKAMAGMPRVDVQQQEVENLYAPAYSRLGDIERNLRAGEQDFYTQYTQPYEQLRPQLTSALEEGKILGRQQVGETEQSRENAVADARRLYNELFAGSQQRFGGSSSAGEFANAYLGREFQRQLGGIQSTTAQNLQKIATGQETLQRNYQSQVQQLDLQKAGALNQAQNLFRQQLNEINNTRFGLEQNKAAAKLQILREHTARVNNLNDYFVQQGQALKTNTATGLTSLQNAAQQLTQQSSTPTTLTAQPGLSPFIKGITPGPDQTIIGQVSSTNNIANSGRRPFWWEQFPGMSAIYG